MLHLLYIRFSVRIILSRKPKTQCLTYFCHLTDIQFYVPLCSLQPQGFTVSSAYFNREMSLLEFNRRVLYQAYNKSLPLLERLRFLCIFSTNLDEFFEVRVGGLVERLEFPTSSPLGPDGLTEIETLSLISEQAHLLSNEQYKILNQEILPLLREHNIHVLRRDEWSTTQIDYLKNYFESDILPVLSPIGLDPAHPFPRILNKSLNF